MSVQVGEGPAVAGIVLAEARELRHKQDTRLRALQTLSRGLVAGFLSAGLVVLAAQSADSPVDRVFGLGIAYTAAVLVGIALIVESLVGRWAEGPDIRALVDHADNAPSTGDFERYMALLHAADLGNNEKHLGWVKRFIALQVCGAFGGGALLLAMLLDVS